MQMSDTISELVAALAGAQAEMPTVHKGAVNPHFGSKFADLADVVGPTLPILAKHGLAVVQLPGGEHDNQYLTTMLMHSSGEWISTDMPMFMPTGTAQAQGSALTYARRYSYSAMVGIVADVDDDGHQATDEAPVRRSSGMQPGSQAAKAGNPASDAQWKFLAKLTKQSVEETRAQYGGLNAAACSTLIDSLKETA